MLLSNATQRTHVGLSMLAGYWTSNSGLPYDAPLWFLRDLMVACILSPVIFYSINRTKFLLPACLIACWFLGFWFQGIPGIGIRGILFFTLGAYIAINKWDIIAMYKTEKYWKLYLLLYVSLLVGSFLTNNDYLLKVSILASFPLWTAFASLLSKSVKMRCPSVLVTGTFFIFMYHYFYMSVASTRVILAIIGTSVPACFIAYILGSIFTISILFVLYITMRKFLPSTTSVLVGGR